MDGTIRIVLIALAASLPAALVHELARAAFALAFTRGQVCVVLGRGRPLVALRLGRLIVGPTARWWWGGECLHAPTTSPRRATAILLAGPLAGDLCFLAAGAAAVTWHTAPLDHAAAQLALWVFALVALARASVDLVAACEPARRGR
jgi:hypothetical protein